MLISVFLPTRNRHAQLRCAAESVLGQSHRELELIVVDDGSTDATPTYLAALAAADERVRVLRHEHALGAPASRNAAVAMAHGEWVTGLDDDDEFLPERLALLSAHARFLSGTGQRFCGVFAQDLVRVSDHERSTSRKRGPVYFEDLFVSNLVGNQILVRRADYLDVGGFDENLRAWQDLDFLLRLTRRFGPAQLLDVPLYVFDDRPRDDRISRQTKQRLLDSYDRIVAKYHDAPLKLRQLLYLQAFSRCYGTALGAADAYRFFRMGFDPAATLRFARILTRRDA